MRSMAQLLEAPPPSAIEAERAVLGSMILDHRVIGEVFDILPNAAAFCHEKHATVYTAILGLYAEVGELDMVQLTQKLVDKGALDQVGGVEYLMELFESVPSAVSASHYARLVVEAWDKRRLLDTAWRMMERVHGDGGKAAEQAWEAQAELEAIGSGREASKIVTRQEAAQAAYERLEAKAEAGGIIGLSTGFDALDDCLDGLQPGNVYLVAARPGMGKTAWALQVAGNVADSGIPALFGSIEMPKEQIGARELAYSSGLDLAKFRRPERMSREEWGAVQEAVGRTRGELAILDAAGMNIEQIGSHAKRLVASKGVGLIVIDYLQLMSYPKGMQKYEGVGHNAKACKQMARRLGVPVVLLSQLNRLSESSGDSRPKMSHIRDSGEVEEAADVVMLLHREDYHRLQKDPNAVLDHVAEIIVGKNRHGPTGVVELEFRGGKFSNKSYI